LLTHFPILYIQLPAGSRGGITINQNLLPMFSVRWSALPFAA